MDSAEKTDTAGHGGGGHRGADSRNATPPHDLLPRAITVGTGGSKMNRVIVGQG